MSQTIVLIEIVGERSIRILLDARVRTRKLSA